MKFPITKQQLQNDRASIVEVPDFNPRILTEFYQAQFNTGIDKMLEELCEEFERNREQALRLQYFLYRPALRTLEAIVVRNDKGIVMPNEQKEIVMKALVEKVKKFFIGCAVFISPVNTSILIDWSDCPSYLRF
jgi:hypothetical protein